MHKKIILCIYLTVWWQTADSFYFHFLKNILNPLNLLNPKNLRSQNSCRQGKIGSTRQGRRSINEENSDENSHENYIKNYNKQALPQALELDQSVELKDKSLVDKITADDLPDIISSLVNNQGNGMNAELPQIVSSIVGNGKPPLNLDDLDDKIVGGSSADIERFPYQVAILNKNRVKYNDLFTSAFTLICGGSIISRDWVVTAGHCLNPKFTNSSILKVRAGSSDWSKNGFLHDVSTFLRHPCYDPHTIDYDFGLIKVTDPFKIGRSGINTIRLARKVPENGMLTVSGWGTLKFHGNTPKHLQAVKVAIISEDVCYKIHAEKLKESMFCAGDLDGGKDSCQGDSGGPIVNKKRQLVGIVSWGLECAKPNSPGIYARIDFARMWIKRKTGLRL